MPITETKKIKNTSDVGKLMEKVESKVQKIVDDISDLKAKYESISNKLGDGTALSNEVNLKSEIDVIILAITQTHIALSALV